MHEWVCRDRVRGPVPPLTASISGKEDEDGQQQPDETRELARQAREKTGQSLDTFVFRIC